MSPSEQLPPTPPQPDRRVRLHSFQWIGVPLLLLLPVVLAAFGVFGESWTQREVQTSHFTATVEWPTRFRYKQINEVRVQLRARSALDTVHIALDSAYAMRFSTVRAIPSFTHPYELSLTDIEAGASALAIIEIQGEQYWRHAGDLTIAFGADTARVRLSSIVFP